MIIIDGWDFSKIVIGAVIIVAWAVGGMPLPDWKKIPKKLLPRKAFSDSYPTPRGGLCKLFGTPPDVVGEVCDALEECGYPDTIKVHNFANHPLHVVCVVIIRINNESVRYEYVLENRGGKETLQNELLEFHRQYNAMEYAERIVFITRQRMMRGKS